MSFEGTSNDQRLIEEAAAKALDETGSHRDAKFARKETEQRLATGDEDGNARRVRREVRESLGFDN